MVAEKPPPTRRSPLCSVKLYPRGQDHCASSCGSVQARNTSSRGALKVRRMTSSRSALALFRTFASMTLLLSLQLTEIAVESAEAALPVAAVTLGPLRHLAQRLSLQTARTRGSAPAAADEPGALEHLQVLGDRRLAHGEGPRELHHPGLTAREAGENGTACRVGKRGEGLVQVIVRQHSKPIGYITYRCFTGRSVRCQARPGGVPWWGCAASGGALTRGTNRASPYCHIWSLRCALPGPERSRDGWLESRGLRHPHRGPRGPGAGVRGDPASCFMPARYSGESRRGAARRCARTCRSCQPGCAARVVLVVPARRGSPRRLRRASLIARSCATAPPHLFARAEAHFFARRGFPVAVAVTLAVH